MGEVVVDYYSDESEFEKPKVLTLVETALDWVQNGWVRIKYTPQLSQKTVVVEVQKYAIKDIADRIGRNVGFFTDDFDKQLAISTASIKWVQYIEDYPEKKDEKTK